MRLRKEFGPIVLSIAYCRGRDGNRQIVCCHLGHQMFFMYRSLRLKLFPVIKKTWIYCEFKKKDSEVFSKNSMPNFKRIQVTIVYSMQWDSNSRNNLNKFQKKTILWISAKLLTNQKSGGIIPIVGDVWLTNDIP